MFYFLSKALTFLIMPMGLLIFTLLIALLTKNHARRRKALFAAVLVLMIGGNGFITNELLLWWEVPPATLPARIRPRVGVILTGGLTKVDGEPRDRIYLGGQVDRVGQALLLYKSGQIQKIMISGGMGDFGFSTYEMADEGQTARRFLIIAGVPAQDILLENKSRNTHENALFSASVLQKHYNGYENVLITSSWHMRRAIGCFQKQNVTVTPYPADFISGPREFSPYTILFPSERAFFNFYWIMHEFVGYTAYKIMGYI